MKTVCTPNPKYTECNWKLRNHSCIDADYHFKEPISSLTLDLYVAQIDHRSRTTVIINRKYNLCENVNNFVAHYVSLYINYLINAFTKKLKFECPIQPSNLSMRDFKVDNNLITLPLFYKPRSYFFANATFLDKTETSSETLSKLYIEWKIQKKWLWKEAACQNQIRRKNTVGSSLTRFSTPSPCLIFSNILYFSIKAKFGFLVLKHSKFVFRYQQDLSKKTHKMVPDVKEFFGINDWGSERRFVE